MTSINTALAVLHVSTGLFFTVSGYRKLFIPEVRHKVQALILKESHDSAVAMWAVPVGEFLGGLGLLTGTLVQPAAAGLLLIMTGAYFLDTLPAVKAKQGLVWSWSQFCSNALCNPEAQLIVCLTALLLAGGGAWSLDHLSLDHVLGF